MYRLCAFCGSAFNANTNRERYCSIKCRQKQARQNEATRRKAAGTVSKAIHVKRACLYCGKEFVSSRKDQVYCSASCRALASRASKQIKEKSQ